MIYFIPRYKIENSLDHNIIFFLNHKEMEINNGESIYLSEKVESIEIQKQYISIDHNVPLYFIDYEVINLKIIRLMRANMKL